MLAGTDDHLTWLSPVILNLENMGLTHLESEIRVAAFPAVEWHVTRVPLAFSYSCPVRTKLVVIYARCKKKKGREKEELLVEI